MLVEEALDGLREGRGVGDVAVAEDPLAQQGDRAALDGDAAVDGDLGGGEVPRVELEPDEGGLLL